MSRRSRTGADVTAIAALLTVAEVRADATSEMLRTLKATDTEVSIGKRMVGAGDCKTVAVYAVDKDGRQVRSMDMTFSDDGSGRVMVDSASGRSALDALDGSLSKAVAHQARENEKHGWRTQVRYWFTDAIYADPARAEDRRKHYGVESKDPPPCRDGYEPRQLVRMQPGRDKGTWMTMSGSVKKRK